MAFIRRINESLILFVKILSNQAMENQRGLWGTRPLLLDAKKGQF